MAMPRLEGGRSVTVRSAIFMSPLDKFSKPEINRNNVDLPQPEGPTNTTNSPLLICKSTSRITCTLPNDLLTPFSTTSAISAPFQTFWTYEST